MKINTASRERKNIFDRSTFHLTTFDFGKMFVTNILPLNPNDTVNCKLSQFFRMAPLAVPTYGSMRVVTKAFFVPFRLLTPNWDNFYRQSVDVSLSKILPSCTNVQLFKALEDNTFISSSSSSTPAFDYRSGSGTTSNPYIYWRLNDVGRNVVQILNGLGYNINPSSSDATQLDLMPLLAFLRVCYDWLYPSRYVDLQSRGEIFELYNFDPVSDLASIVEALKDFNLPKFDDDFFIRSWVNFNTPAPNTSIIANQTIASAQSGSVIDSKEGDFYVPNTSTSPSSTLSSAGLRLLQSFSDISLRTSLTGHRFIEYIKGVFGFASKSQRHDYSTFIKSFTATANLMDVTNVAAGDTEYLGAQAGKGYISGDDHLSYDVDEHGYMIFVSYLLPATGYYQGRAPWTIAKSSPYDYYRPEYDSLGNEAIRRDAVYADYPTTNVSTATQSTVFGFAPRYAWEYKTRHDFISGDFRLLSKNKGLESYHTFRVFKSAPVNNAAFQTVNKDFDRIFATSFNGSDSSGDHFVGYFNFDLKVASNMLSISESMPFFNKSGREVDITTA